jgi:hypothetical protein
MRSVPKRSKMGGGGVKALSLSWYNILFDKGKPAYIALLYSLNTHSRIS